MSTNSNQNTYKLPVVVAISLAFGILLGSTLFGKKNIIGQSKIGSNSSYNEILMHIKNSYVDSVNIDSLSDYGIEKMLEKLDPHTAYIPASDAEIVGADLQDGFDGIGVEFNIFNDSLYVVAALGGGPSEAVGIKSGDIILRADSVNLSGTQLSSDKVFKCLRGPRDSKVKLLIKRKSVKNLMIFTVKRDKIPTFTIDAAFLMQDKKTGYIKINRFAEQTYEEFKTHLASLKKIGMTQLILDLRGNPGGYMDRATDIVDEMVGGTGKIVYTKGMESSNNYVINAGKNGMFEKGKVVVLVDEGSASASEIVSGALQDYDRATVVGRRTFGKGLVQAPIRLSDGGELRLTVSRYYIPSGRSIQKPYVMGNLDGYMEDMHTRYKNKEMFVKDSTKQNGRPKYKTAGGRTVYGGGGITPDVFVPQDTSHYTLLLASLFSKNTFRDFLTLKTDVYQNYKNAGFGVFSSNNIIEKTLSADFKTYLNNKKISYLASEYSRSEKYIANYLKALLARNLWKDNEKLGLSNEFHKVLLENDKIFTTGYKSL